jgi:hypothetical protein
MTIALPHFNHVMGFAFYGNQRVLWRCYRAMEESGSARPDVETVKPRVRALVGRRWLFVHR